MNLFNLLFMVCLLALLEFVLMNITVLILYRKPNSKFKSASVFSIIFGILLIILSTS